MAKKIYALLIGINKYAPSSKVTNLSGCIKDIEKMKKYLEETYPPDLLDVEILIDENATRDNILQRFQDHLIDQAQKEDSVLFYFSGHGSFAKTAPEFSRYDPMQQDETIVCYDSRLPGQYDLADKELAVLISKIKEGVHIVMVADSCHSESVFRGDIRSYPSRKIEKPRALSTYFLEGSANYYIRLKKEKKKIIPPISKYIAFSACTRKQFAKEKYDRGVFSYHFLETLKKIGLNSSYKQLFEYTKNAVLQDTSQKQLPILNIQKNFDPRCGFLTDKLFDIDIPYLIQYHKGGWYIDCGAIYGLPVTPDRLLDMRVAIFQDNVIAPAPPNLVTTVCIKEVKLTKSLLFFENADKTITFRGTIINPISNIKIYLNGSTKDQTDFLDKVKSIKPPTIQFLTNKAEKNTVNIELQITDVYYKINRLDTGSFVHGCTKKMFESICYILKKCLQIEKYQRILKLDNPQTKLDKAAIEFRFVLEDDQKKITPFSQSEISLEYTCRDILFQLELKNNSRHDLYIALLHLAPDFGINVIYACTRFPGFKKRDSSKWIVLDNQHYLAIQNEEDKSVKDFFKLVVSTKRFNEYKFVEKGLKRTIINSQEETIIRGQEAWIKLPPVEDWFTKTICIELFRQE